MKEIRQRIKSKRGKLNRYNNQVKQYQQNRTFRNNEAIFYKIWNGDSNNEYTNSNPVDTGSREFWDNKFIIRILNGFQISNLNSETLTGRRYNNIQKISQENA